MSDETARLKLAELVSLQELNAVTWNEVLAQLDVLVDLYLLGQFVNSPPPSPSDGDAYLIGGAPTGAWSGYSYKIASCLDGAWRFYTPYNGLRAFVGPSGTVVVYLNGVWTAVGSTDFATKSGNETLTNKTLGATTLPGSGLIDAAGRIGIGITPAASLHVYSPLPASGDSNTNAPMRFDKVTAQTAATRSFLLGSVVSTGDMTDGFGGRFKFLISDNSVTDKEIAALGVVRDGGDGKGAMFFQTARTDSDLTEAMRITSSGNIGIGTNSPSARLDVAGDVVPHTANSYSLGSSANYWANGYIQNAWTVISDETLKQDIAALSAAELAVAKALTPLVVLYRMKTAVAAKGDAAARRHCGWIAQRLEELFRTHGLDPFAYGCVGCDPAFRTVRHSRTVVEEDGGTVEVPYEEQVPDCDENGVQRMVHNIRADEIMALALAGLAARVAALESQ